MSVIAAMAPLHSLPGDPHMAGNARSAQSSLGLGLLAPQHCDLPGAAPAVQHPLPPTSAPAAPATRPGGRTSDTAVVPSQGRDPASPPAIPAGVLPGQLPMPRIGTPHPRPDVRCAVPRRRNRSHGGARAAAQIRHPAALIAHQTRTITPARGSNRSGNRCAARAARPSPKLSAAACCAVGLPSGGLPSRLVMVGDGTLRVSLGVIRAGRLGRVLQPGSVLPGLGDPGLGLGRPGLRACHRLVPGSPRLLLAAAALASRASASRASASAAAARALRASASARSARA